MSQDHDLSIPLPNAKQEAFVQALLQGETATQAYASAGYKPNDANAARLNGNDRIKARLAYLQGEKVKKILDLTAITAADVIHELARMAFSSMKRYSRVTAEGDAYIDLSELSDDDWAAIQEMSSEEYMEGRGEDARLVKRTKIKLHGKERPLIHIGKHLGLTFGEKAADKGTPGSGEPPAPKAPEPERLAEIAKRYSKHGLRAIKGGKEV